MVRIKQHFCGGNIEIGKKTLLKISVKSQPTENLSQTVKLYTSYIQNIILN